MIKINKNKLIHLFIVMTILCASLFFTYESAELSNHIHCEESHCQTCEIKLALNNSLKKLYSGNKIYAYVALCLLVSLIGIKEFYIIKEKWFSLVKYKIRLNN